MATHVYLLVLCVLATTTTTTTTTTLTHNHNQNNNGASGYTYGTPPGGGLGAAGLDQGLGGGNTQATDPIAQLAALVPGGGVPGVDYPILSFIPNTGFQCTGLKFGYYADSDPVSQCQVFHICPGELNIGQAGQGRGQGVGGFSFLCPNGTVFSQQYLVCAWWFNVDCEASSDFFSVNDAIGEVNGGAGGGAGGVGEVSVGLQAPTQLYATPN